MSQSEQDKQAKKAAMKGLRVERKTFIKVASAKMKLQKKAIQAILDQLKNGAQTVPAIAAATGASTAETLWYMAALKKYGEIKEAEKDGGYFKYELAKV
ncbi:MAG: winged helix-turn-helix domain-containing protein [Desulfosarcina sp.]|nr:winged helix-turn-helix domain-containing protein [Desulfosarcina sp.]MBC2743103.1 winged helix-turn-helix domain-containing protein [Desulfosarcina sp.]MBC2766013.1 winged helix-turn-helix domain-containing protein [Desulfosarcina sp.]